MRLTYSHIYIENASTCGTIRAENLLKTGKRPQVMIEQGKLHGNGEDKRKKKREKRKEARCKTGPAPLGESWK